MNSSVTSYTILFFVIFILGFVTGFQNGDEFLDTISRVYRWFKKNKLTFLTRKYWYNKKLQKKGILKQVLCLMNSHSTDPNASLVCAGIVYNVIAEREVSTINWGDKRGAYVLQEHGWTTEHSRSIFVDYYGDPVHKLMDKYHDRIFQLRCWLNDTLSLQRRLKEQEKHEQFHKFKLLK